MKRMYLLIIVSILSCFVLQSEAACAQIETNYLYLLTSSDTDFVVTALNSVDGSSVTLLSVPASAQGGGSQLFPSAEIDALNLYLIEYNATSPYPVNSLSQLRINARIESISVSPDNQQLVAKVIYQTCLFPQNPVCFGTTQLVLIDRDRQHQRVLLNLGDHANQFLQSNSVDLNPETQIGHVQWPPDQQAIVVEINDRVSRYDGNSSIVVVPLNGGVPFKIGEGRTWAIAPSSEQLVLLSNYNYQSRGMPNTLSIVNVDIQGGQFSQMSYVLENYFIDEEACLAFWGHFVVFSKAFDPQLTELSKRGGGLVIFDTYTGEASMVLPDQFFLNIKSTPDAEQLVLETSGKLLVKAQLQGNSMRLQPLVSTPVATWNLSGHGDLLIQFSESGDFQLLDSQGKVIETPRSFTQYQEETVQASKTSKIIAFDW